MDEARQVHKTFIVEFDALVQLGRMLVTETGNTIIRKEKKPDENDKHAESECSLRKAAMETDDVI